MLLLLVYLSGCSKKFDEINTDPSKASQLDFDPNYLFTTAQLGYGNVTEYQLYEFSCMTQLFASTFDYYGGGDKYDQQLTAYNTRFFIDGMTQAAQLTEAQSLGEKDPEKYHNLSQLCRIFRVLIMQRITDVYGDIPYFQAGQGKNGVLYPVYDAQEAIYKDMLVTLDDAIQKLDANKPLATGDLLYAGDIDQWKKFGYSIMLRVAMRLSKVASELARQYAEKAAKNTFASIADNAIVKLEGGPNEATINRTANAIGLNDFQEIRWSKTFIDYLKSSGDPRLYALTEKADTGLAYNQSLARPGLRYTTQDPTPTGSLHEVPIGMPNGHDISGAYSITTAPGYPGPTGTGDNASPLGNYARPRMDVFTRKNLPVFLVTYSQTELLLAEAKIRGWDVGAVTAAQHFQNGVQAALQALPQWDAALTIPADTITQFMSKRILDESSPEHSLQMINAEYWAASIFDFTEAWSNWRRSNYPLLTPVNYPGNISDGAIPRRLPYPPTENATNPANYRIAIRQLGGSDLSSARVWWDKQ
ncbi:MAG: SusD/RagB family nutrient-binding outer membrane lipoprotein [Citrobacter freundii]|nr:MAG: SusD/RagB family nutrient-binding outer membrane lipoprotein [Citrobacter freundii]